MTRSIVETILGAVVLAVAGYFLFFSYKTANVGTPDGYNVYADFAGIGGLKAGDDVQISGVKVGKVESVELQPETYLARVNINLDSKVKLPTDTAAVISSESLLGGRYLALQPGADEELLAAGERVQYTQAPQSLEELLGKFIFSMQNEKEEGKKEETTASLPEATAPAPAPVEAVTPADPEAPDDSAADNAPADQP